jgi:hypothetical protein
MAERDQDSTEEWTTQNEVMSCKVPKILKMFLFTVHVKQKLLHQTVKHGRYSHARLGLNPRRGRESRDGVLGYGAWKIFRRFMKYPYTYEDWSR